MYSSYIWVGTKYSSFDPYHYCPGKRATELGKLEHNMQQGYTNQSLETKQVKRANRIPAIYFYK